MESNGQPSREALVVPVPLRSTGRERKIMEPLVRAVCGAPAQARCARCARERYCSSACQRAAWRTHKRDTEQVTRLCNEQNKFRIRQSAQSFACHIYSARTTYLWSIDIAPGCVHPRTFRKEGRNDSLETVNQSANTTTRSECVLARTRAGYETKGP
jgi:hypothetical protein